MGVDEGEEHGMGIVEWWGAGNDDDEKRITTQDV